MRLPLFLFSVICLIVAFSACEIETEFVTGNSVELRFSTDTVTFDTVFAARGSATEVMKVYNQGSDPIMIDRISVDDRTGVKYIFNVDGTRGPVAENIVIWGNDSIFVFVEVEVDPTEPENVSPFIAEDRLIFETGDNRGEVVLLAFGQNANYLNGFRRGEFAGFSCDGGTAVFPNDLPVVIYGSLVIDNCTVQALAGTKIYVHGGVQRNEDFPGSGFFNDGIIFTTATGSLQLLGTREDPVIVRTDRLEPRFANDAGKYRGLIFSAGSRNNILEHTQLLNTVIGITIDSLAEVRVENSVIAYSAGPAITTYQSDVTVRNSVFHSNFGNTVNIVKGGNVTLEHTTIANYGVDATGLVVRNFICDQNTGTCLAAPVSVTVENSIIAGSNRSEISLLDIFETEEPDFFNVSINNSVVRTDNNFLAFPEGRAFYADFYEDECQNCHNLDFQDALFQDISEDDYQLDTLSVAQGLARFLPRLPEDILGVTRDREMPDAGAFEREE